MEVLAIVILICLVVGLSELREWKTRSRQEKFELENKSSQTELNVRMAKIEETARLNEEALSEIREFSYLARASLDELVKAKDSKMSYRPPEGEHYEELN